MTDYIQVITTVDKKEHARNISMEVVERRLAACVQINGPVTSIYRWKEKIEEQKEWVLVMKTRKDLYRDLERAIRDVHTYEVPEIIAVPLAAGSDSYLGWLDGEVRKS